MDLFKAALFFDRDKVYDGYTGVFLFKAQFSSYDGSQLDGSFIRRRTVSFGPKIVVPDRRVVSVLGERWVVGTPITDGWDGKAIRLTASSKSVTDLFEVLTPGQLIDNLPYSSQAYAHTRPLKETVNTTTDSEYDAQYEVSFGVNEPIPKGMFLKSPRLLLHVRSVSLPAEGFVDAIADDLSTEFDSEGTSMGLQPVQLQGGYNPIDDTMLPGATVMGLVMDMYKLYEYQEQANPVNTRGDKTLLLSRTVQIKTGDKVTINQTQYTVVTKQPYMDAWNLQIRKG